MILEGIIKEIEKLSLTDIIRLHSYMEEKYERTKKDHPNSFPSAKWKVNNPEKAREKSRIQAQHHRDRLKEKEIHNNLKI